jgi:hypothetical protein
MLVVTQELAARAQTTATMAAMDLIHHLTPPVAVEALVEQVQMAQVRLVEMAALHRLHPYQALRNRTQVAAVEELIPDRAARAARAARTLAMVQAQA